MTITIESPHITLPARLTNEIKLKISHAIKIYERITACEIIVRKDKNDQEKNCLMEVKLLIPHGFLFSAERAATFEEALDKLIATIKMQLTRHKEKLLETDGAFDLN